MNPVVEALIGGCANAALFVGLLWIAGPKRRNWLTAALLIVAGLIYINFAVRAGRMDAVPMEIVGTAIVGAFAVIGIVRRSPAILALGWALHPIWDVVLHTGGRGTYTPDGYVVACIGFDLLVAAAVLRLAAPKQRAVVAAEA